MTTVASKGPLPIVVGVTGHNDLRPEDLAPLSRAVRGVFESLRARYPRTPLLVISPLAEGADRLVAKVALDLGLRLLVPLPLEVDAYKEDFHDAASRAEFDGLLSKAERSFVMPPAADKKMARPHCYARVGAYIARHCHVLLALWNGSVTNKIGGTAEIVRERLEGMTPESVDAVHLLDAADSGLVYQIITPRRSDPSVAGGQPLELKVLAPARYADADKASRAFEQTCRRTDDFNKLAVKAVVLKENHHDRAASSLLAAYRPDALPAEWNLTRQLHALADEAAIRYQRYTQWALLGLFWIAVGLVISFELYAHGEDLVPAVPEWVKLVAYLALFVSGVAVYGLVKWRGIDTKHLDYRALAEALRVEFYWRVAQVPHVAADFSMHHRLEETEWIRLALRANELCWPSFTRGDALANADAAVRAVAEDWVKGQFEYFGRTVRRDHRQLTRLERRTAVLFGVGAVTGAVILLSTFHLLPWGGAESVRGMHAMMVAVVGLSTATAALIHGYADRRALSAHIKRYGRMRQLFEAALRLLHTPIASGDWREVREVLGELGREALEENADWVALHRERLIELPT